MNVVERTIKFHVKNILKKADKTKLELGIGHGGHLHVCHPIFCSALLQLLPLPILLERLTVCDRHREKDLKFQAQMLCRVFHREREVECQLRSYLNRPQFQPYESLRYGRTGASVDNFPNLPVV